MPYLNLDLDYFTHPKVTRLETLLGKPEAVMFPIRLWCYAGKYFADSGMLQVCSKQDIEKAVGWSGESGKLVDSLVEIGFLELKGECYRIHDWKHHAGHLNAFKKRAKAAASERWRRYATSKRQADDKHANSYAPCSSSPSIASPVGKKEEGNGAVRPKPIRGTVYPEGFQFDPRSEDLAKGYGLNVHKELAAFRDFHVSKGSIFKDWQAAFRTWIRNSVKFATKGAR